MRQLRWSGEALAPGNYKSVSRLKIDAEKLSLRQAAA